MRSSQKLLVLALSAVSSLVIGPLVLESPEAQAQSRRSKREPKAAPVPAVVDAGAPIEDAAAPVPPPAPDAGALSDAGLDRSPLTPRPDEFPQEEALVPAEYDRILADLTALRARIATASDSVFRSRLALALRVSTGRTKLRALRVAVDGATVYTQASGFRAEEPVVVFDRGLSPGRHVLTLEVESEDLADKSLVKSQLTRLPVDIPRDHRVKVEARVDDSSDLGERFARSKKGGYDLRLRLKVEAAQAQ